MKIFLIGFMGSGKSKLGKSLASFADLLFADIDEVIEIDAGKSIPEIFKNDGEEQFRVLEHEALLKVINTLRDAVIAVGGGTPCFFDHMKLMNRAGITIYLKYTPDKLFEHLKDESDKRPLLSGKTDKELFSYIQYKLKEREPFYNQSRHIISWPEISVDKLKEIVGGSA